MKVLCSVCGRMGFLQVRGKSARVGHYLGYSGKTRMVEWRRMDASNRVVNGNHGNQSMVINKSEMSVFNENKSGRSLAWLGHRPPTPTTRVQIPATAPLHLYKRECSAMFAVLVAWQEELIRWRGVCFEYKALPLSWSIDCDEPHRTEPDSEI